MSDKNTLTSSRNYGIDLLRIVSMLMVVILHVLGQGGVLKTSAPLSVGYEIAWFLEIMCYCAVNCYALISGYVGVGSKFKYSNIVNIWLQVIWYSVGIAFVAALVSPKIYLGDVFEGFLPVSKNLYWYFTAYFCIFFFIPAFNCFINAMSAKQLKIIGVSIFALFSVLQIFAGREIFYTNRGYSAIWLAMLYVLGGILKKTEFLQKINGFVALAIFFAACLFTWIEKFAVDYINTNELCDETLKSVLVQYTSPTILVAGIMLVVFFAKIKTGKFAQKFISFFAPLSFGVYLIHVQKHVWIYLLKDRFVDLAQLHPAVLPFAVLGCALAIFLLCAMIDFVRDRIFSLLRVKKLLVKLETKFLRDIWAEKSEKIA